MRDFGEMLSDIRLAALDNTVAPQSPPEIHAWSILDCSLSNFDHAIPEGLDNQLRGGNCYCAYAAWNFHAHVWFEDGEFRAFVRSYRRHAGTYSADTLDELMRVCSDNHGWD